MSDGDRSAFDPFAPVGDAGPQEAAVLFPEDRWRRAGANDEQITGLRANFDTLTPEDRRAEVARIDAVSDGDLAEQLPTPSSTDNGDDDGDGGDGESGAFDLASAKVDEIKDYVGDDKTRAGEALAAEQAQAKPRKTLVAHLEKLVGD